MFRLSLKLAIAAIQSLLSPLSLATCGKVLQQLSLLYLPRQHIQKRGDLKKIEALLDTAQNFGVLNITRQFINFFASTVEINTTLFCISGLIFIPVSEFLVDHPIGVTLISVDFIIYGSRLLPRIP